MMACVTFVTMHETCAKLFTCAAASSPGAGTAAATAGSARARASQGRSMDMTVGSALESGARGVPSTESAAGRCAAWLAAGASTSLPAPGAIGAPPGGAAALWALGTVAALGQSRWSTWSKAGSELRAASMRMGSARPPAACWAATVSCFSARSMSSASPHDVLAGRRMTLPLGDRAAPDATAAPVSSPWGASSRRRPAARASAAASASPAVPARPEGSSGCTASQREDREKREASSRPRRRRAAAERPASTEPRRVSDQRAARGAPTWPVPWPGMTVAQATSMQPARAATALD
mmetsp:Transcript_15542/g.41701  ORF Transcript_15542/g.41701 Transcript_15542/m.41701 type:complete len:294 (+) Transcript_15542:430-1311(+)